MLQLVEGTAEILEAQKILGATLKRVLKDRGIHNVGFPSGNEDYRLFAARPGEMYWALSKPNEEHGVRRFVNSFGVFADNAASQQIVVEISIPECGDNALAGGMFARDPSSGEIYLLHSGKVGGGYKGVGTATFRAFHGGPLELVRARTRLREAILIGSLSDRRLPALLWQYVQIVIAFKQAVRRGDQWSDAPPSLRALPDEAWGHREGQRSGALDYYSYHGAIYAALKQRTNRAVAAGSKVDRTQYIDLAVWEGNSLVQIFEIKTGGGRQSLYTAIGQLMTHAPEPQTVKTLVLPHDTLVPRDCLQALKRLSIRTQKFAIEGEELNIAVRWIDG